MLRKLPTKPTITYLTALILIAALFIFSYINLQQIIREQKISAYIINISGRQRMFTEKVTIRTIQLISSSAPVERNHIRAEIINWVNIMEETHAQLTSEEKNSLYSDRIKKLYFEQPENADARIRNFLAALKLLATAPDEELTAGNSHFQAVLNAEKELPDILDTIVSQYQRESELQLARMQEVQKKTLFLILFTLVMEAVLIFRPMIQTAEKEKQQLIGLNVELSRLSSVDGLTGIANRRYFDQFYEHEFERALRQKSQLALIILDIDHFKNYNDAYGHLMGDDCLKKVAKILADTVKRSSDLVARFGGEEFIAVLPDTDASGALAVAETLRYNIEAAKIPHDHSPVTNVVTVSLGISWGIPAAGMAHDIFISKADQALYEAKHSGRNRHSVSPVVAESDSA